MSSREYLLLLLRRRLLLLCSSRPLLLVGGTTAAAAPPRGVLGAVVPPAGPGGSRRHAGWVAPLPRPAGALGGGSSAACAPVGGARGNLASQAAASGRKDTGCALAPVPPWAAVGGHLPTLLPAPRRLSPPCSPRVAGRLRSQATASGRRVRPAAPLPSFGALPGALARAAAEGAGAPRGPGFAWLKAHCWP